MHEPERSHLPARPTRTAELASTEMRLVHHVHAAQKCVAAAEAAQVEERTLHAQVEAISSKPPIQT